MNTASYLVKIIILSFFFIFKLNGQDTLIICKNFVLLGSDTLNQFDNEGKRQGEWIEYKKLKLILRSVENIEKIDSNEYILHEPDWIEDTIVYPENYLITFRGKYIDNLKEGNWIAYHKNGKIWKNVNFKGGKVIGDFSIYYDNGKPKIMGYEISDTSYRVEKYLEDGTIKDEKEYSKDEITDFF